jgi:hypothetical protein
MFMRVCVDHWFQISMRLFSSLMFPKDANANANEEMGSDKKGGQ